MFITLISSLLLSSFLAHSSVAESLWLQRGCRLEDQKGNFRNFPGTYCLFQDDGTFISADMTMIRKYGPDRTVLWELPYLVHHQMKFSHDKKRILALISVHKKHESATVREDEFLLIDQSGKILAHGKAVDYLKQSGLTPLRTHVGIPGAIGETYETSHFNSIYEIPPHAKSGKLAWLAPGNVILNSAELGVFVVSPDLKKVLKHISLADFSVNQHTHDVQVSPDGDILFFNNHVKDNSTGPYSAVQKIDPETKKITLEITTDPKLMFYSIFMGGVQEMDDGIFFSHMATGGYYYSKKQKTVTKAFPEPYVPGNTLTLVQEVKLVDVQSFLSKFQ